MDISTKLRELRKAAKLSQAEVAETLQTTQQHYSTYENGKHEPPLRHIVTLCKLYNVTSDWLLGLIED